MQDTLCCSLTTYFYFLIDNERQSKAIQKYIKNNFCKKCSDFFKLDYCFLLCNIGFYSLTCLFETLVWKKFTFVFVGLRRLRMAVLNRTFHSSDAIYFSTPLNLSPIVQNSKGHWKELRVVANGWVHIFKKKHLFRIHGTFWDSKFW